MKMTNYSEEVLTLEEFAEKNGLVLLVCENSNDYLDIDFVLQKYSVGFLGCARGGYMDCGELDSIFGIGKTRALAIKNLVGKISNCRLVYHPYGLDRRDILVPTLDRS